MQATSSLSRIPRRLALVWSRSSVTRLVLLLVGGTVLFGAAAFILLTWQDRRDTLEKAAHGQAEITRLMEEHLRATMQVHSVMLNEMVAMVAHSGMAGLSVEREGARLHDIAQAVDSILSLWIINAEGQVVLGSKGTLGLGLNVADRAYFRQAQEQHGGSDFIAPLFNARISDKLVFSVDRRLEDDRGHFLGVVHATVDLDNFIEIYRRLSDDPGTIFGIYTKDRALVVRYPLPAAGVFRASPDGLFKQLREHSEGSYLHASAIDGIYRLNAFRLLPDLDLVLVAGQSMPVVMAGWRGRTLRNLAFILCGLPVMLLLAGNALAAARRADEARHQADAANAAKSTFFASASHDLRQPYQAMRLFWMVIDNRVSGLDDPRLAQAVANLGQAMDSGEELLNALLDVATIEAGSVIPRITPVAIGEILAAEQSSFLRLAETRGLNLRIVPTTAVVLSDAVLLRRMLRNLLVNALKYTESGGIVMGCRRRGDTLLLQVWDTGKGIPADQQEAIFQDFYQIDNPSRSRAAGLGLGLSVVVRTARLLGCQVAVQSRLGRGSVFTIILPTAPV